MKLTFDANILFYARDADSGAKHETANRLIRRAALVDACLTVQALAETYAALTRKQRMPRNQAQDYVGRLADAFPVIGSDPQDLQHAMAAVSDDQLAFWDAMLWATADRARCDILVSEDFQHGRKLGGVTVLDPFRTPFPDMIEAALSPVQR